jgi:DNA-binding IclR family transcriptional regulator
VDTLNFLAGHPGEDYTLSDLASRLGINVASMHAVLGVLAEAGYVSRHPRLRTYTLGPAVVALGTAALERHRAIDLARDAARDVARQTGLEVAVTAQAGDEIVFVARSGRHSPRGIPVHVGQRVPLRPPIGSVFVAWGPAEGWLAQADDPGALSLALEAVRRRGYAVALQPDPRRALAHALDELAARPADRGLADDVVRLVNGLNGRTYQLVDLRPGEDYAVSMIAAPIFGPSGEVVLALTLNGFDELVPAAEVVALGERLRDTGLVVTKRTRGRPPPPAA